MLSRRDKLLVRPWEERRFNDHRSKVRAALPRIDARAPLPRPHVALKRKQHQREQERAHKIQSDNFGLLQRLNSIMKVNRLDNHWAKPLPNLRHKVGMFYSGASLRGRLSARARSPRSPPPGSAHDEYSSNVRCYACDLKKKTTVDIRPCATSMYLPSIYSN